MRSLIVLLVLTGATRAQEEEGIAWGENPDVRAAAEWVAFVNDKRWAAHLEAHRKAVDGFWVAIQSKHPNFALTGVMRRIVATGKKGKSVVVSMAKDHDTPPVRKALKVYESALRQNTDAAKKATEVLRKAKRGWRDPKFRKAMGMSMRLETPLAPQQKKAETSARNAWRRLSETGAGAPALERDARTVCAWLLYEFDKRNALAKLQKRVADLDDVAKNESWNMPKALKDVHRRAKLAISNLERAKKKYGCRNVTSANYRILATLSRMEEDSFSGIKRAKDYPDGAKSVAKELQQLSFETPARHRFVHEAAKRVLGRK